MWDIILATLLLAVGFVLLVKGADWFVDGSAGLAAKLRIPQLVIGLTIVAFGTSAPELATSVISAAKHDVGIAIGNILGSNICNILLILGLSALIMPLPFAPEGVSFLPDGIIALGTALLLSLFAYLPGHKLKKWHGVVMLLGAVAYYVYTVLTVVM